MRRSAGLERDRRDPQSRRRRATQGLSLARLELEHYAATRVRPARTAVLCWSKRHREEQSDRARSRSNSFQTAAAVKWRGRAATQLHARIALSRTNAPVNRLGRIRFNSGRQIDCNRSQRVARIHRSARKEKRKGKGGGKKTHASARRRRMGRFVGRHVKNSSEGIEVVLQRAREREREKGESESCRQV